jgi:anti-sigma B factor antagonist
MLQIEESREGEIVVLALNGRLDTSTAADFDFAADPHVQGPNRLLIDLGGIQYVSSAGLRIFLMIAKKLQKAGGQLALCCMSGGVREVFDLAGFSKILTIEPDRAAGLARLG